ncbi:MAG: hypothetical protein GY743_08875 [Planctomycetaceae bacterium]|nr:hypothetical protein [Planctomycetaceae bacterium]
MCLKRFKIVSCWLLCYWVSPLTEVAVKASEGDFLLAIDSQSTKGVDNLFELLENKANRQVMLTLNN